MKLTQAMQLFKALCVLQPKFIISFYCQTKQTNKQVMYHKYPKLTIYLSYLHHTATCLALANLTVMFVN